MLRNISSLRTDYVPTAGWSLNPQCNGIWRWGLWEIIRIRWGHVSGASMVGFFLLEEEEEKKKKKKSSLNLSLSLSLPPLCKDTARRCYLQARKRVPEFPPEPNHAGILILDFHPPEVWENWFTWLKPRSQWSFVMTAWADWYNW